MMLIIQRWTKKEKQQQQQKRTVSELHEARNLVEVIEMNTVTSTYIATNCDKENNRVK